MGHRYYDSRQGRFISQDPAGDGDNWYAYADNNPINNTDPTGLVIAGGGMGMFQDPTQAGLPYDSNNAVSNQYMQDNPGEYNFYVKGVDGNYDYAGSKWEGATAFDQMNNSMSGGAPGAGMIAGKDGPTGRPESYEPGIGPSGAKGVWKNYKDGQRVFEPDAAPPVKKKGHGDGGRNQGTDEGEHSRNAKGNRTPRSTGGGGMKRFSPLIAGIGAAGTGYLIYVGIKDGIALLGAPETGGASLILLAVP